MRRIGLNRFNSPRKIRRSPAAALILAFAAVALAGIFTAQAQNGVPTITGVEIDATPAFGTSYRTGEEIFIKITFSEEVFLSGNGWAWQPHLKLSMGGIQNRTADYHDHAPENVLYFAYHITAADRENYGISIANKLDGRRWVSPIVAPAGGRITGRNGAAANLDLGAHAITNAYGHRVNAITPEPPANVRAKPVANGIVVTWEQPGRITPARYAIERRTLDSDNAAAWFWVDDSSTAYTDTANLTIGVSYEYRVKGYQRGRQGISHSSRISAAARVEYASPPTPTPTPTAAPDDTMPPASTTPVPPDDLYSASSGWAAPLAISLTHNSVTIYWSYTVSSVGLFEVSPVANGYRLYRRAADAVEYTSVAQLPLTQTSYQDTGLLPGTTYTYRIYEDHPLRPHNLIADLTFTTDPAPTQSPTPDGSGASAGGGEAGDD